MLQLGFPLPPSLSGPRNGRFGLYFQGEGTPEAQKWAAGAIAALSEGNEFNQMAVAEDGGIAPLVELLKNREQPGPHENAIRALWHLSYTADNQLSIARDGSLPPLVTNLSSESDQSKEYAAAALESLSKDCAENQVALSRVGAIPPLVVLLGSERAETQSLRAFLPVFYFFLAKSLGR